MDQPLLTFNEVVGVTQDFIMDGIFPVSFDLLPGEIGIFRSGHRASALTRLAALRGIITCGSITILGTTVRADDNPARYLSLNFTKTFIHQIGFCHHSGALLANMSILQNVMLPAHYHGDDPHTDPFLEISRTRLRELDVPEEYWPLRPSDVPRGIQKRALLARSIATVPRILILDEPTEHIPWAKIRDIIAWIQEQKKKGMGILIATSNDPFALILGDWLIDLDNNESIYDKKGIKRALGVNAGRSSRLF